MAREAHHFMKHIYNQRNPVPSEHDINRGINPERLPEGFYFIKVNFEIVYCRKKQGASDFKNKTSQVEKEPLCSSFPRGNHNPELDAYHSFMFSYHSYLYTYA